jgi:hypothetical protein
MRKTVMMLLLAAMSSSAMAEWVLVGEGTNGTNFYIDPKTIKKDGNLRRAWLVTDLPTADDRGIHSRLALQEFDCKGERRRTLSLSVHSGPMAGGNVIRNQDSQGNWQYIAPGTTGEAMLKLVCSK